MKTLISNMQYSSCQLKYCLFAGMFVPKAVLALIQYVMFIDELKRSVLLGMLGHRFLLDTEPDK